MAKKAIKWESNISLRNQLLARATKRGKFQDFCSLIAAFPGIPTTRLYEFVEHITKDVADESETVLKMEQDALQLQSSEELIETVVQLIEDLNNRQRSLPSKWAFFDKNQTAVVHFVRIGKWYAEIFVKSSQITSALHICNGVCIPVKFGDIGSEFCRAKLERAFYLKKAELPRESGDLLSKGGHGNVKSSSKKRRRYRDKGDSL